MLVHDGHCAGDVGIGLESCAGAPVRMPKYAVSPTGRESVFGEEEIIVSKTDAKGRITYANEVFLRVSGFAEEEVIEAPHSVVRHPHMPRCIFKLMWDTIQSGQEMFGYVLNMAKDGDHYWVLAHVTPTFDEQRRHAREMARVVAGLVEAGHRAVVTHGNGPQVGNLLLMAENSKEMLPKLRLDYWGANTQGGIGYMLQSSITNELGLRDIAGRVITLVTMVVVDLADPAFSNPTKPVGPFFTREEAERYARERDWCVAEDSGRGWRRRVPSPRPVDIVETGAIRDLLEKGYVVVGVGGGGIPVIRRPDGTYHGIEAVIDKDLASALAARLLGAEILAVSTDVSHAVLHYGRTEQRDIGQVTAAQLAAYAEEGHFPPGSMGPKVEAALEFLKNGGKRVVITDPAHLAAAVEDPRLGTSITP